EPTQPCTVDAVTSEPTIISQNPSDCGVDGDNPSQQCGNRPPSTAPPYLGPPEIGGSPGGEDGIVEWGPTRSPGQGSIFEPDPTTENPLQPPPPPRDSLRRQLRVGYEYFLQIILNICWEDPCPPEDNLPPVLDFIKKGSRN